MKKNIAKLIALLLASVMVFAACTEPGAVESQADRDSLVVAWASNPPSFDPIGRNDTASAELYQHLYNGLVEPWMINGVWTQMPGLAHSWAFPDPQTLVMELRQGVKFHNGEEFKASDVKFSLERAIASPDVGFLVDMIKEVEVNSDYQVTLHLEYAFAPILSHLGHACIYIVNEKAVREMEDAGLLYSDKPVGTGPMKYSEFISGDKVVLERFEDYWGEPSKMREITFRIIPEPATRQLALEAGEVDVITVQPNDIERFANNNNIELIRFMNFSTNYIGMNALANPAFEDVRVRQAVNHAMNMDAIIAVALNNTGATSQGPVGDMVWASTNAQMEPYNYDVDKAKALMKEAGYENGFDTVIWYNTGNQVRQDISEMVQSMLREININVTVEGMDWPTYLARLDAKTEHEMFVLGWVTATGDPDYGMYSLFHSEGFDQRTGVTSARLDELLEAGRTETDTAKRLAIYAEAQQIVRDDASWVFTNQGETLMGLNASLAGFDPLPHGSQRFWVLYFE